MSTTAELLKGAAELFPGEVVTQAHVRHLDLPGGAGRVRADHAGQRPRPHQADHLRPAVAGEPGRRDRPGREGGRGRRDRRRRHHRQAVHLRGRRRPQGRRAAEAARGRAGHRQGRPRRLQAARPASRCRPSRTTTARRWAAASRSACTAPTAPSPRRCPAFSLPEVFLGLVPGWGGCALLPNLIGAGPRGLGHHRELAQPEPSAQGQAGLRTRHRRRALRGRGLPGAVADLDRGRPQGRDRGRASRGRPRRGLGPGRRARPGHRRLQGARRGPGRLPRAGDHRRGQERRPAGRASTPRTRRSPT